MKLWFSSLKEPSTIIKHVNAGENLFSLNLNFQISEKVLTKKCTDIDAIVH
jgi:hypothetical protein